MEMVFHGEHKCIVDWIHCSTAVETDGIAQWDDVKDDMKKFWTWPRFCTGREHNTWKSKVKQQQVKHRLTVENDCYAACVCMRLLKLCHMLNSCLLLMTSSVQRGFVVNVVGSKVGRAYVVFGRH